MHILFTRYRSIKADRTNASALVVGLFRFLIFVFESIILMIGSVVNRLMEYLAPK